MNEIELEAMIERAAKRGAREALESIGLHDDAAVRDVMELRGLLEAWRDAKSTAWKTVAQGFTMLLLTAMAAGMYVNFKGPK